MASSTSCGELDAAQFEAAIRREAAARKEPCILDLCARNARDFEQGRPELVFRDLGAGVVKEVTREAACRR